MDMWQGYIGAVQPHAPQAAIVFDRFRIARYLTKAVDDVRKQEFFRRGGIYRDANPRQEVAALDQAPPSATPSPPSW